MKDIITNAIGGDVGALTILWLCAMPIVLIVAVIKKATK